jgi:YD repeat-containing protein
VNSITVHPYRGLFRDVQRVDAAYTGRDYDCNGLITSVTDHDGRVLEAHTYDALNRLTHKGYPDSTGVDYVYDLAGKIKQVTDPTGPSMFTTSKVTS